MVLKVASLCMYLFVRIALRSSLRWARATYSGLVATILPFISVTAFVASSGEEKQTKPKPLLWEPSVITYRKQNVHSQKSLRFLTLKHKRKQKVKPETLYKESLMALNTSCMGRGQQPPPPQQDNLQFTFRNTLFTYVFRNVYMSTTWYHYKNLGIEPPILKLMNNPLYLLSHSAFTRWSEMNSCQQSA